MATEKEKSLAAKATAMSEPQFRHPSGVSLDPHGMDKIPQELDINVTDSLADNDAVNCMTAACLHLATFKRCNADQFARHACKLLNEWYRTEGIPRVAVYDQRAGEITTRNSIV